MADLGGVFKPADVEPPKEFDEIPNGEYIAVLEDSPWQDTQKGNGRYIALKWKIVDGPCINRVLFDNLNLVNANETAVKIANETLGAIGRALGVPEITDTVQLHGTPCTIVVKQKRRKDTKELKAQITAYKAGTTPKAPTAPAPPDGGGWAPPRTAPAPTAPTAPAPPAYMAPTAPGTDVGAGVPNDVPF